MNLSCSSKIRTFLLPLLISLREEVNLLLSFHYIVSAAKSASKGEANVYRPKRKYNEGSWNSDKFEVEENIIKAK